MIKLKLIKVFLAFVLIIYIFPLLIFLGAPLPDQQESYLLTAAVAPDTPLSRLEPRSFNLSLNELDVSIDKYDRLIRAASKKHSLDPALVKAVIHAESQFDPQAVSPKGAMGLMQLDPITVKELGIGDPFNPKYNIYGGVRYLRLLIDTFEGDKNLALAAYNAGPGPVHRHRGVPPFKETKKYVTKVLRYLDYYKQVFGVSRLG